MQGNLLTTLIALIFYITTGLFGGNSGQSEVIPAQPVDIGQNSKYPLSGIVASQQVNIRNDSQSGGEVIGSAAKGAHLVIIDEKNGWYRVQTENGTEGWVAKWMVSTKKLPSGQRDKQTMIAGYYVENYQNDPAGQTVLTKNLGSINTVIPFSYKVDQYGAISGRHYSNPFNLAKSSGAQVLALVNNIQGSNFSSNTIHKMLSNASARSRAVNGILRLLVEKGYRGVNIDFENVPARDRAYLTAFFRELAAALRPRNLLVTASIPAKTYDDRSSAHSGAYDYQAIAPYLDQVMIMTYDEHYAGGAPGPVASLPWVEKVVKYALQSFPAQKIVLGLAAYGYDWGLGSGKALHFNGIQNLIRKHNLVPKWHAEYKVPYFTYKSWGVTHQVWYENSYSASYKVDLVKKYGLKGIAVWRLGYEDPNIWSVLRQKLL
ncbi:MAG: SH3 domain-containing protein [Firmicutes bacterium]|nr:SH3 domain-containing protein [Bacillota bacterium]